MPNEGGELSESRICESKNPWLKKNEKRPGRGESCWANRSKPTGQWCKRVHGKSPDSREPATFNVFFATGSGISEWDVWIAEQICRERYASDRRQIGGSEECCSGCCEMCMMTIPWFLPKPYLKRFEVAPQQREVSAARFQLMSGLTRSEHALIPDEASQMKPANLTAWLMLIQIQIQMLMLSAYF